MKGLSKETSFATSTMVCKTASNVTVSPQSPGTVLEAPHPRQKGNQALTPAGRQQRWESVPVEAGCLSPGPAGRGGQDRRLTAKQPGGTHDTPYSLVPPQPAPASVPSCLPGQDSQQAGLSAQGSRPYRRALPTQTGLDPGSATCCPGWGLVGRGGGAGDGHMWLMNRPEPWVPRVKNPAVPRQPEDGIQGSE